MLHSVPSEMNIKTRCCQNAHAIILNHLQLFNLLIYNHKQRLLSLDFFRLQTSTNRYVQHRFHHRSNPRGSPDFDDGRSHRPTNRPKFQSPGRLSARLCHCEFLPHVSLPRTRHAWPEINSSYPSSPFCYHVQQDQEPLNQQSACTIGGGVCTAPTPLYPSTSGPAQLPDGVYAAAIVGLGPTDCTVCGTCYSLISSGTPYCDPNGPPCKYASSPFIP